MIILSTRHISPQFYVVFDDELSIVPYITGDDPPPNWSHLLDSSQEIATYHQANLSYD